MNALHLVDPGRAGGGAVTLRYAADLILERENDDCVVVLGHRGHARLAQRCGLRIDGLMPVPRRGGFRSTRTLRSLIGSLDQANGGFDMVHAWSLRAGELAMKAWPALPCAVSAMVGPIRDRTLFAPSVVTLGLAMSKLDVPARVFVPGRSVEDEFARAGIPRSAITCAVPGVDMSLLASHRQPARTALRTQWGVEDDALLVGLITQPFAWGNARAAASIVTLPVTANRNVKLLVHPDAMRLHEAYEWARPLDLDGYLAQESDLAEPWRVLAGLDVALWLGNPRTVFGRVDDSEAAGLQSGRQPVPSTLPILWAFAAGLPVIAERCDATTALIRDGENGILIDPHDVPEGARHTIALFDDPELRRSLGEAARRDAEARFTIAHAAEYMNEACAELMGGEPRAKRQPATAVRSPSSASAAST